MDENARLQKQVDLGSQELNKTALQGAQWAEFSAQQQLKAAQDEGDAEKIAQATQLLTQAQIAKQNASQYAQRVAQHIAQQPVTQTQEQPVAQPQAEEKPQIDPLMEEWSNNNPWFMEIPHNIKVCLNMLYSLNHKLDHKAFLLGQNKRMMK